ncbi:DNA-directed RNA polymerase III subunit RPC6 [Eumeta japonica]|uniref:DNA-directed RNA polymerase III subunit RPC6 n=1 Tax=Eumeta variegata TaxID=151549 RepID=A0A4C1UDB3_EUMVA|nr:DNA-directed RNA polymerase III subunit RPC6 [Eumeta japonica]
MSETSKEEDIKEKILNVARGNPKGISDKDITNAIPETSPAERVAVINKLLQLGLFDIFNQNGILTYRLKVSSSKQVIKGADNEEKVVYALIEEAGNKGIWIRDIRRRSNLAMTQLTKVLKSLEGKKNTMPRRREVEILPVLQRNGENKKKIETEEEREARLQNQRTRMST